MGLAPVNTIDEKISAGSFESNAGKISIHAREDADSIHKTKKALEDVVLPFQPKEPSAPSLESLEGRVTLGEIKFEIPVAADVPVFMEIASEDVQMAAAQSDTVDLNGIDRELAKMKIADEDVVMAVDPRETITLSHPAIDPENLQAIDRELARIQNEPLTPQDANFLIKVREVIGKILAQFSEISEKDRFQMDDMKQKYRKSSQEAADLQRSLGNAGLWIAGIGFAVMLSQFGFKNPADREVMKFLSEQCPNVGGMFTSRYQANQKEADALSSLLLAEYNAKTSKSQSESSSKQEIVNLLDKALESMKRAASAG